MGRADSLWHLCWMVSGWSNLCWTDLYWWLGFPCNQTTGVNDMSFTDIDGYYIPAEVDAKFDEAQAEIDRLKAALQEIANLDSSYSATNGVAYKARQIAKEALK